MGVHVIGTAAQDEGGSFAQGLVQKHLLLEQAEGYVKGLEKSTFLVLS